MASAQASRGHREHREHRGTKRRDVRRCAPGVSRDSKDPEPAKLIIDCKYINELPKPPVPKLLRAMPSAERLYRYQPTALELDHRPFLLTEKEMMSRIELVDYDAYGKVASAKDMKPPPPPKDAALLRDDDISQDQREAEEKRRRLTEPTEAWHREGFPFQFPQLLTNDLFVERQRFTTGTFAAEKKMVREPPPRVTNEELALKVERTFEAAQIPPVHPSKPHLKPKRVLSIVPDAVLWANKYRQVIFDELPKNPQVHDLLYKTTPTPRATCFGYYTHPENTESKIYKREQNYIWDNRGSFSRSLQVNEGETMLISFPSDDAPEGEARFVTVPPRMKLKKQKAHSLNIDELDTDSLHIKLADPSPQEAQEEHERMNAVLSDDVRDGDEGSDAMVEYVDGEWHLQGRAPSSRTASMGSASAGGSRAGSAAPTPPGSPGGRLPPIADSPHASSGRSQLVSPGRATKTGPELPTM